MKFHKNKLLTTGAAVALALAVGACSSSSDDDEMAGTPPTPPVMDGDGGADAMNGDDDTKTPVERLDEARDALVALPDDATDEAKEMAQELVDEALQLPGNEAALIASLEEQIADQAQTVADATAKAEKDERIAREAKIKEAIKLSADRVGTAENMLLPDTPSGVTAVMATRNAAGKLTVDVNSADEDDVYAGGENTAGSSAWNYVMMTKTNAVGVTDTLVIYTDIDAPTDVQLTKCPSGDFMSRMNRLSGAPS